MKQSIKKCIFCKILENRKEKFIFEDKVVIVLLSKFQTSKGHAIVLPKKHYESVDDMPEKDYLHLHKIVKKYHKQINKNFKPEKIYVLLLAEEASHIHFHLIPRYKGDTKGPAFLTENIQEVKNPNQLIKKINKL